MIRKVLCIAVAVLLGISTLSQAASAKPVCVVANSYGIHEARIFIKQALTISSELEYLYDHHGTFPPIDQLNNYSLVAIFNSTERPFTSQECDLMQKYLESGGHLLLGSFASNTIAKEVGAANIPWLGVKSVTMAGGLQEVLKPEHPFLKGVFDTISSPQWLTSAYLGIVGSPSFETIIGTSDSKRAMVGFQKIGKGWVAFLGHEAFRFKQDMPQKEKEAYYRIFRNIVEYANPLTEAAARKEAVERVAKTGLTSLLWNREWQRNEEYGPRFSPILPSKEELITSLSAKMAIGEYEALQLNFTPLKDPGLVSWKIESPNFPLENVGFFVQDSPAPIPWPKAPELAKEYPYWLMPPEYIAPKGKKSFFAPAGETRILWIKLNSSNVVPGEYRLQLTLSCEKMEKIVVPISVIVYPVQLPRNRMIALEPAGQVYGDVDKPEPALPFTKNLESHGYQWSLINLVRTGSLGIVGEKGLLTSQLLASVTDKIISNNPPRLDCSRWDPWMEQAISHGLIYFTVSGNMLPSVNGLLSKTTLSEESKEKIRQWFLSEISRYLREKGVRVMITSFGDELNEKEIRERYIPWAKSYTEAGWGCSSSFTGAQHLKPELNALLYPYVKLWTLNRGLAYAFTEEVRKGTIKVRPDAIIGTYGAGEGRGSEHRKPLGMSRFLGWESWMNGIQNCATNPYFKGWIYYADYGPWRGIAGERWVSYIDKDDPTVPLADCPFLEGIREGMEEGNLCVILSWYLDKMEKAGAQAKKAAEIARKRLDKVLGDDPSSIIQREMVTVERTMPFRKLPSSTVPYIQGKAELLEILASIRKEALAYTKPSVWWNDIPLIKEGVPVALLCGPTEDTRTINEKIEKLTGISLPVAEITTKAQIAKYQTAVIVGNSTENPLTSSLLQEVKEQDADLLYPGAAGYSIREAKANSGRSTYLFIAGGAKEGTVKGAKLFTQFLRAEGGWILP
jgi:hypothetical protein